MDWILATLIGLLYGSGLFLMMRRTLIQLIIGLGLLSHGANLLIFVAGGYGRGNAPILEDAEVDVFISDKKARKKIFGSKRA